MVLMSSYDHDFDMGTGLCGTDCRMLDDTYKLAKCVKIALLYLEVKFNIHIFCDQQVYYWSLYRVYLINTVARDICISGSSFMNMVS